MSQITKTERQHRERLVRAGEWDQCWITLTDGREFFARKAWLDPVARVVFHTADGDQVTTDMGDVVKAVH